jgi:hypothetical protein
MVVDDVWYGDDEAQPGRLVPLYVLVGGRTIPRNTGLDLATQVLAYPADTGVLEPEYQQIVTRCSEWISIAEVAAHLGRPLTVVRVLIDALLDQGFLAVGAPAQQRITDRLLLETLLAGLQRL